MLKLALLGHPQIQLHDEAVTLSSSKGLALLCYLAIGDRPYSRTHLAGLFWGEKSEAQARRNLRVALTRLRQTVGDYLVANRKTVAFDHTRDHWLDVSELQAAEAHLDDDVEVARSAINLIRGNFLEDLQLREAPEFELWLLGRREHYRERARKLMSALTAHDMATGQYEEGLAVARKLVVQDPWQEEGHRLLIHFLALNGEQGAALVQYEKCRQILAEELGVEPSAETRKLVEAVRAGKIRGRSQAPKLKTPATPNNLPVLATSFVGRHQEMRKIHSLLEDDACRLLLLLGPGGIGKSRLALEAARVWLQDPSLPFPDGLFFVSLADTESEAELVLATANALGLTLRGEAPPAAQLLAHLRKKRLLLILDNFEHLAASAGFLLDLLGQGSGVKLLVTSRERLPLLEAWNLDLDGLGVPPEDGVDDALTYGAVRLFEERARRINLSFDLGSAAAPEVAAACRICRLVEGMPLALELAAAWTRGLPCQAIAERIAADAEALAFSSPSLPARQRSLEAIFQHSWGLLDGAEQRLFAALSLFRGGFDLAAAQSVAGAQRRQLLSLVDKSLVRRLPSGRYDIHPLLRRLANGRLAPARTAALRTKHAQHYARFLADRDGFQAEEEAPAILDEIALELDNVRAAWRWVTANGDTACLERAMDPLSYFYDKRGYFSEGLELFAQAADAFAAESVMWARLRFRQARFAFRLGQNVLTRRLATEALPVLEAHDNAKELAGCLLILGNVVRDMGDHAVARDYFRRSVDLFAGLGDHVGQAAATNNLGLVYFAEDDVPGAIRHFEAALMALQRAGVTDTITELGNIGLCYATMGEHERAIDYLEQSLDLARQFNSRLSMGLAHHNLGIAHRNTGNTEASLFHLDGAIELFRELNSRDALAAALADLAGTLIELERFDAAHEALREGMALEEALQRPRGIAYKHLGLGNLFLAQNDDAKAGTHFQTVLSDASEAFGVDLLLNALLGIAAIEIRAGRSEGKARQVVAGIATHRKASYETKQAAQHWSERLKISLDNQGKRWDLEPWVNWALGRDTR